MSGLLSFLLFGGLFFLLMRFGCGAHMAHGEHGAHGGHGGNDHAGHGETPPPGAPDVDPVCGMPVSPGQGYTKNHEGRVVHFCSRQCLDKFEAAPQRYAA